MIKRNMLKWAAVAVLALGGPVSAWAGETPATLAGAKVVGADEVKRLLDSGAAVVDTRVAAEHAEKTIKGAKSVPYKEKSTKDTGFDAALDQFDLTRLPADKSAPLVLFCNAGECWKSYKASAVAVKAGYAKVHWFRGGMPEWVAKGLPVQ
jgi:rhodanese-related sulfurtransferase